MSHIGESVPGYYFWDGAKLIPDADGGGGALAAVQTYPVADIGNTLTVWSGAGGGFGNLYAVAVVPAGDTEPLAETALLVTQAPGGGGGVGVGIYDSAGVRLAYSNITAPILGVNVLPLVAGVGTVLTGGTLYYFAVYSNQNGAVVGSKDGISSVPSGTPPLGFEIPNSSTQPGALQGQPANISAFFGTQVVARPWSAVGS
jgi:hypothetical protein